MSWNVEFTAKSKKQVKKLPLKIRTLTLLLAKRIETEGPMQKDWKNFSKLSADEYHCHLKGGKPTYVVCWRMIDKKNQRIEVYYVGTHENASY